MRHAEAKAAQVWWRQWVGFEMQFKGVAVARWLAGMDRQGRLGELAAQFTARNAVHPMQALHNYAVGIVAARMTRVVVARGLDPCFGFLHDGSKPGRLSLVWDCVEPMRPELVRTMFQFAGGRMFKKADFAVTTAGVVRLTGEMAREIFCGHGIPCSVAAELPGMNRRPH